MKSEVPHKQLMVLFRTTASSQKCVKISKNVQNVFTLIKHEWVCVGYYIVANSTTLKWFLIGLYILFHCYINKHVWKITKLYENSLD